MTQASAHEWNGEGSLRPTSGIQHIWCRVGDWHASVRVRWIFRRIRLWQRPPTVGTDLPLYNVPFRHTPSERMSPVFSLVFQSYNGPVKTP